MTVVNASDGYRQWKARYNIKPFTDTVDDITREALEDLCPEKRVLLHHSTGKDSTAAWLTLRDMGFEVIPVFKEVIPNLSFIDSVIEAHEKFFETKIHRVPYAKYFTYLYEFYGDRCAQDTLKLRENKYKIENILNLESEFNDAILTKFNVNVAIIGVKGSDNLSRRVNFQMNGPYNSKQRMYSLCWRLAKNAPLKLMLEARCPIPKYYLWLGRSPGLLFDSEYYFIKKYYPDDWHRICEYLLDAPLRAKNFEHDANPRILQVSKLMQQAYDLMPELFV